MKSVPASPSLRRGLAMLFCTVSGKSTKSDSVVGFVIYLFKYVKINTSPLALPAVSRLPILPSFAPPFPPLHTILPVRSFSHRNGWKRPKVPTRSSLQQPFLPQCLSPIIIVTDFGRKREKDRNQVLDCLKYNPFPIWYLTVRFRW